MELQGNRLHVGTELLSGTASDDRVLMSFNGYLGYHILRKAVGFVRPDLGLRASVGYAGIDSRGVMYLGGALYSGLSFQISRSCHVRFAGEGGAQGWGRDSPARNVIGAFAGTSLTVGITPQ